MGDTRGYQTRVGEKKRAPRATTIAGMLNKPGLPWGAAKETALFAIHHKDEWIDLDDESAYHRLRKHHRGVWDDKANRGTLVHDLALEWSKGNPVDCPVECGVYMDALERFYVEQQPEFIECEQRVVYQSEDGDLDYGGRFDLIARVADIPGIGLLDYKTGGRYPTETALQLSSYRYATGIGVYDAFDTLTDLRPLPQIDYAGVVYLHDDGTYELLEVPADEAAFATFMELRRVWNWQKEMERWEKAHPEPTTTEAVAS